MAQMLVPHWALTKAAMWAGHLAPTMEEDSATLMGPTSAERSAKSKH